MSEVAVSMTKEQVEPPSSVKAALAAKAPEIEAVPPKDQLRTMRIRNQLLLCYGMLTVVAFGMLIGIVSLITSIIENSVIDISREELTKQILNNSKLVMRETASVLTEPSGWLARSWR